MLTSGVLTVGSRVRVGGFCPCLCSHRRKAADRLYINHFRDGIAVPLSPNTTPMGDFHQQSSHLEDGLWAITQKLYSYGSCGINTITPLQELHPRKGGGGICPGWELCWDSMVVYLHFLGGESPKGTKERT